MAQIMMLVMIKVNYNNDHNNNDTFSDELIRNV